MIYLQFFSHWKIEFDWQIGQRERNGKKTLIIYRSVILGSIDYHPAGFVHPMIESNDWWIWIKKKLFFFFFAKTSRFINQSPDQNSRRSWSFYVHLSRHEHLDSYASDLDRSFWFFDDKRHENDFTELFHRLFLFLRFFFYRCFRFKSFLFMLNKHSMNFALKFSLNSFYFAVKSKQKKNPTDSSLAF